MFRLLRLRARRAPGLIEDAKDVLLKLFDADAEYSADTLEGIYDELEKVSKQVLAGEVTDTLAGEVLGEIARQEDLNGRIRRNVMDTRRAVSFMMRSRMLSADQFEEARQILRDIESLDNHTAFLFDKINFLMDATVGFININQNKIIKIFSVASVALLPPTLIASVYGMNFKFMPELQWSAGYPWALGLMAASALVPMCTSASAAGFASAFRTPPCGSSIGTDCSPSCCWVPAAATPRATRARTMRRRSRCTPRRRGSASTSPACVPPTADRIRWALRLSGPPRSRPRQTSACGCGRARSCT